MAKSLVSIIVPTFNEEKNIERLLESVISQSYKQIETIVVDDGSTDKTVEVAKKLATKTFKRKHAERSIQRNFGASKASGDFLLFLDADMELTKNVVEDALSVSKRESVFAVTIPEKTIGDGLIPRVRAFEREMYMGDPTVEVARFFDAKVFNEVGGYDPKLTGPEDYDLPYRISKKYSVGRSSEYILHHEAGLSLPKLLRKKFYYASHGAVYAQKHPELISSQGNLIFRKAYIKHWKNFVSHPVLGGIFIVVRIMEATAAILGYIHAVGIKGFLRALRMMFS